MKISILRSENDSKEKKYCSKISLFKKVPLIYNHTIKIYMVKKQD